MELNWSPSRDASDSCPSWSRCALLPFDSRSSAFWQLWYSLQHINYKCKFLTVFQMQPCKLKSCWIDSKRRRGTGKYFLVNKFYLLIIIVIFTRLQEAGGYFIVNGYEKVMRLLLVQKRNYVSRIHFVALQNQPATIVRHEMLSKNILKNDVLCFSLQPMAIRRQNWSKKGAFFTDYGLSSRCLSPDNSFVSVSRFPTCVR